MRLAEIERVPDRPRDLYLAQRIKDIIESASSQEADEVLPIIKTGHDYDWHVGPRRVLNQTIYASVFCELVRAKNNGRLVVVHNVFSLGDR
jgi:hypothetical protein